MRFEFATATRIVFGTGSIQELPGLASQMGRRALLVVGGHSERHQKLVEALNSQLSALTLLPITEEPSISMVAGGVRLAREERCEVVIALGGGSVLDAGKAIAGLLTNPGDILDYLEVIGRGKPLNCPSTPFIAVPTTAGTGSEVTRNAVLYSPAHRVKVSLRSPLMLPRLALIDPQLTYRLPRRVTAFSGLDALTQVLEPYVSRFANPMTDSICEEGLRRASDSLRSVFLEPTEQAREDMCLTSLFGGLALANAGLGAVHGLAGPLGGLLRAPHGLICASLLPHVVEKNLMVLQDQGKACVLARYQRSARLLTGNPEASAWDGLAWIKETTRLLEVPTLVTVGLTRELVSVAAEQSLKASSMKANPVALDVHQLSDILHSAAGL